MDEAVTYTAGDISTPPDLRLIHFNDGMPTGAHFLFCKVLKDRLTGRSI